MFNKCNHVSWISFALVGFGWTLFPYHIHKIDGTFSSVIIIIIVTILPNFFIFIVLSRLYNCFSIKIIKSNRKQLLFNN